MSAPSVEEIRRIVRQVVDEVRKSQAAPKPAGAKNEGGPRVLIVYHGGTARADEAREQAEMIGRAGFKSGVLTSEAARQGLCGLGPDGRPRGQCVLDTVDRTGLEKVLERADVLVLPTFCLSVAAKVARLEFGDPDAGLVLSALVQGKPVLAADDGFLVLGKLRNEKLRTEFGRILSVLADWGVTFTPTDKLAEGFNRLVGPDKKKGPERPAAPSKGLKLVSADDIRRAVNEKKKEIPLAPGGLITPLARDLAKEYSITISTRGA